MAHDLAALVRHAPETGAPNCSKLLDRMLTFGRGASPELHPGIKKVEAILAGYFLLRGYRTSA